MVVSYVGVGSNIGGRGFYIKKAIELLRDSEYISVEKASSLYNTEPVGGPRLQGKFLNGVLEVRTSLAPQALLKRLQYIEKSLFRERTVKDGPRTIDLDILTYGPRVLKTRSLEIPHPRLHERGFVLKPFCQLAPDFVHPVFKRRIKELYGELMDRKTEVIRSVSGMERYSARLREKGRRIGFVPTMGYFHDGHLSLMRKARKENDIVVASVFVNPAQFGPREDLKRYPRAFKRDRGLAASCGVDAVFYPAAEDMYPADYHTYVEVEKLTENLCGASRPGHFRGVATVVAKLFNIVRPHTAYFGQKDAQQAAVIRRMVKDLNMPVMIRVLPIVREKDGLAMSSRNVYLSKKERKDALVLYESLLKARNLIRKGQRNAGRIKAIMRDMMQKKDSAKIDYISVVDASNLEDVKIIRSKVLIAVAVRIGKTRLIDNIAVGV